jgi:FkbM family methyltransferase
LANALITFDALALGNHTVIALPFTFPASNIHTMKNISIIVPRRDFIEAIALPILPRLRLYDPAQKPQGLKKLKRKSAQVADDIVHGWMKFPAKGKFTLKMAGGAPGIFEFDAHQSAYLAFVSRALYGNYEIAETLFLEAMLAKSRCFYDIGANWGYYTLVAATHPAFTGQIHSFEISNEMNAALSRMTRELQLASVYVMECGLSDQSGYVTTNADRATQLTKVISDSGASRVRGARVKVARLDDLDIPPPDLMKIDVEDHEYAVLDGGRKVLADHRPIILFESRDGDNGGKAGELLKSYDYHLYGLQERPGMESAVDLLPINPADDSFSHHLNLVAVPIGDEARWFD